jgi:plasmid stability protein
MIQLRNVPDALHRGLKARAAMAGMSLSDYLLGEIKELAERLTLAELRERLHKRKQVEGQMEAARRVREEREGRGSSWMRLRQLTGFFRPQRGSALRPESIREMKLCIRLTCWILR